MSILYSLIFVVFIICVYTLVTQNTTYVLCETMFNESTCPLGEKSILVDICQYFSNILISIGKYFRVGDHFQVLRPSGARSKKYLSGVRSLRCLKGLLQFNCLSLSSYMYIQLYRERDIHIYIYMF